MKTQMFCDPAKMYVICVDSYEDKILEGRIYNVLRDSSVPFKSAVDMLVKLEMLLDDAKLVQSYSVKRVFTPNMASGSLVQTGSVEDGKLATFSLKLLFRQNASWQGSVLWCDGNSEESFRSVLELLLLMDNALSK
ncbi:MAG: hypothetical protein IJO52_08060 [Clostridia bacterium]|nr:hypothetical protein [Clostridia bacterium]